MQHNYWRLRQDQLGLHNSETTKVEVVARLLVNTPAMTTSHRPCLCLATVYLFAHYGVMEIFKKGDTLAPRTGNSQGHHDCIYILLTIFLQQRDNKEPEKTSSDQSWKLKR